MKKVEITRVTSPTDYEACLQVRRRVFIEEQGVPASIEIDEFEKEAQHFLARIDTVPVGAGRLRKKKSYAKFERIATLGSHRGYGVGREIMRAMQNFAADRLPEYLPAMHAQNTAIGFYEKLGWIAIGEEFLEADIAHRVLILPPAEPEKIEALKIWHDAESRDDIRDFLKTLLG